MTAAFLHGVETIEILAGTKSVKAAKTAVIGLVGTAPTHQVLAAHRTVGTSVLCLSDVDDAQYFGPDITGYTIPAALKAIRDQGVGTVIVVNVFDPDDHKTTVAAADIDIVDGKIATHADLISYVVKVATGTGNALVEGVDFEVDTVTGEFSTLIGGALDGDGHANIAYVYGNPAAVVEADVIGEVGADGVRVGAQAWLDSGAKYGFMPKILIAPVYSTTASMVAALAVLAAKSKCRAVYIADAPIGTTVTEAITGRGPTGDINFEISDDRGILTFPYVKRTATELQPQSQYMAGVMAANDETNGFWKSPSNKVIKGVVGLEIPISAALNDATCQANVLNEAGICTVFNAYGTGFRTWGNRSSAFPASAALIGFIKTRRVSDQIHESLEMAMLEFVDDDITDVVITAVLDTCNGYMRVLAGRRAVPKGSRIEFNTAKNPAEELALGHVTFDIVWATSPPLERVTFESFIDVNLLGQ
jgi:uncharacterized protein